jgi:hypothetical protein
MPTPINLCGFDLAIFILWNLLQACEVTPSFLAAYWPWWCCLLWTTRTRSCRTYPRNLKNLNEGTDGLVEEVGHRLSPAWCWPPSVGGAPTCIRSCKLLDTSKQACVHARPRDEPIIKDNVTQVDSSICQTPFCILATTYSCLCT